MVYTMASPTKMIVEHTEVNDELRGKNIGKQLVEHIVEYAQNHNIKDIPLCPFTNSVFKKKPEFADVLFNHVISMKRNFFAISYFFFISILCNAQQKDNYILLKPDRVFDGESIS